MTISDILSLIDRMSASGVKALAAHAETLRGPRSRGSVSEKGLEALPQDREGVEFQPSKGVGIPGCRYLEFAAPEIGGRLGACRLADALAGGLQVRVRSGKHGYELFVDRDPQGVEMLSADSLTVILGPDETGTFPEVVWTWHPGRPMASACAGVCDDLAVKLHNG